MVDDNDTPAARMRWARLRFAIVGPLLSAPADAGELWSRIVELASKSWRHPTTGEALRFSPKTIERWYYIAKDQQDPIKVLERKVNKNAGTQPSISFAVAKEIKELRAQHPTWSFQLVYDNLKALADTDPALVRLPGYASVCRYMRRHGLWKQRRRRRHEAEPGFVAKEMRSFEVTHSRQLWHTDFHEGSRSVLLPSGEWQQPVLFAVLDDHSRLCCHIQWYLGEENREKFVHGFSQALMKRGLPRALLSDNGKAFTAAESAQGLERLSITQHTTLAQTPEQNGKQEKFWDQVEGRLMAMLDGEKQLTLELLNFATQAWAEGEYNKKKHDEIGETPLQRHLRGPDLGRPCPSSDALRRVFTKETTRTQRRSDGTITVEGVRFEIPSAYRTLLRPCVRVARWDLSSVDLVDPRTGAHLKTLLPLDKHKNAERGRRAISPAPLAPPPEPAGIAPLLKKLMAEYAATGLPPAYIPMHDDVVDDDNNNEDSE
jgi:transposase InsO family protein